MIGSQSPAERIYVILIRYFLSNPIHSERTILVSQLLTLRCTLNEKHLIACML